MSFEAAKGGYGPVAPRHRRPPGKRIDPTSGGGIFLETATNPYREDPFDARYDPPREPARPARGSSPQEVLAWMRARKQNPQVFDYPRPGPGGAGITGDQRSYSAHRPTPEDPGLHQSVTPFRPGMFGEDGWTLNEQQYREQRDYDQNWQAPELWKPFASINSKSTDGTPHSAAYSVPRAVSSQMSQQPGSSGYMSQAQDVYALLRADQKNKTAARLQQALQGRR